MSETVITDDKLYLEDFTPGREFDLGSYFISREELIGFGQTFDPQDFHVDEQLAKQSPLGVLCASGIHTLAACTRLTVDSITKRSAMVAGVGLYDLKFSVPVLPDEAISVTIRVRDRRRLDCGKRGLVSYEKVATNPRGEEVLRYSTKVILLCREAA